MYPPFIQGRCIAQDILDAHSVTAISTIIYCLLGR